MNATDIFTRRIHGMDYRVWGTMLLVCFLSIGLYGYKQIKFNRISHYSCPPDTIAINGKRVEVVATCYMNRYVLFEVQSEASTIVTWNFRDGSDMEKGKIVSHKFIQEGNYRVTATVNGQCEFEAEVEVVDDPFLSTNQQKPVVEIFADPMPPTVGNSVKLYCVSDMPSIASYEWRVTNTNEIQKVAEPIFTFQKAENYSIELVLNNDPSKTWVTVIKVTREMQQAQETDNNISGMGIPVDAGQLGKLVTEEVNPLNSNKKAERNNGDENNQGINQPDTAKRSIPPKAPEVDPGAFRDLLQNVVDQEGKELEDLYEYLDYKESTMVKVNDNTHPIPIKDFCKNMRDKKKNKRKIETLIFKRDDRKSIQVIEVKVPESKGFWARLNPFD